MLSGVVVVLYESSNDKKKRRQEEQQEEAEAWRARARFIYISVILCS